MDRRVKERLVGASILVVLIVLIVPELLSGPPGPAPAAVGPRLPASAPAEAVRNVTVDLATSKAPEPDTTAAEAAASSAPPPEAHSAEAASAESGADANTDTGAQAAPPADAPSADTPAAAAPPRSSPSRSLETAAPAPISSSAMKPTIAAKPAKPAVAGRPWAVQLGSFASHANADKLVRQVRAQGYSVYIVPGGSGASLRYRVRIGPMADRGTATQTIAKLKSTGQAASLVSPAP
jgi:DedD protein